MIDNSQKQRKMETGSSAPVLIGNQELQFPVTYRLKTVLTTTLNEKENKKQLLYVFDELKLRYLYQSKNRSSKGTYVSFTYEITLNDRQTMNRLYELLKRIENLKFAL